MPIKKVKNAMHSGKNTRTKKVGKFYTVSLLWILSEDMYYLRIDDKRHKGIWWNSKWLSKTKAKNMYDNHNSVKKIKTTLKKYGWKF